MMSNLALPFSVSLIPPLLGTVLLIATGCASNYQRAWKSAAGKSSIITPSNQAATPTTIPTRWSGTWLSEKNGHNGRLRCIITPSPQPGTVDAWFDSTYAKVLRFKMKSSFDTERATDPTKPGQTNLRFSGSENLGKLFGVYDWEGTIHGDQFRSSYRAKIDHGVFEMQALE